jgi:hypothetical protein
LVQSGSEIHLGRLGSLVGDIRRTFCRSAWRAYRSNYPGFNLATLGQ